MREQFVGGDASIRPLPATVNYLLGPPMVGVRRRQAGGRQAGEGEGGSDEYYQQIRGYIMARAAILVLRAVCVRR